MGYLGNQVECSLNNAARRIRQQYSNNNHNRKQESNHQTKMTYLQAMKTMRMKVNNRKGKDKNTIAQMKMTMIMKKNKDHKDPD
jgi:DNA topoisomerase VI subunit B